jgi:exo-beta-1,3-glucanase (GH17 family)
MNKVLALLVVALLSGLHAAGWWWFDRPVPVALSFDEPFPSVSFAPFRRGQSPLTHDYPTPEQVAEDLKRLQGVTRGVRTYTSLEGMGVVPALAGPLGIEVTHSAWIGEKPAINAREVEALIASANAHPDAIKRVIVGNEVLLRQDQTPEQLIAYIRQVKAQVGQPVSYADVWAFWLKYPEVANEVDFITIHILPYWEDEPLAVEACEAHIIKIVQMMKEAFPGKPILIGEAGWPTQGRSRGAAVASMENAALFVRTLARVAKANGFDYNVVEAFDQPWKAKMEGTVGANWGVVDADRRVKFAMSGPVVANPGWVDQAGLAVLLGAFAGLTLLLRRAAPLRPVAIIAVAALAQILAGLCVWQAANAWALAYGWFDQVWAVIRIALHTALGVMLLRAAAQGWGAETVRPPGRWAERLVPLYAYAAILSSVLLLVHGRYRDIPPLDFLVPCLGVTAFALGRMAVLSLDWRRAFAVGRMFGPGGGFTAARPVALSLVGAAAASLLSEAVALGLGDDFAVAHPAWSDKIPLLLQALWINHEMDVWAVMVLVMALPFVAETLCRRMDR